MPGSGTTTTYTYDGFGKRLQASTGTQASKKTNYLWDIKGPLAQIALERDGNNGLLRRYVNGQAVISMTSGNSTSYFHADPLGSVTNMTSSSGTTQWTYAYEPFGLTKTETKNNSQAPTNFLKFTGQYLDPTGLYHLRARQYDPTTARFLSRDPVAQPLVDPLASSYVYAIDRPTTLIDPSGLATIGVCAGVELNAFVVTLSGHACAVASTSGEVGVTATGGISATSLSAPGVVPIASAQVSNARCINQLGGPFYEAAVSGEVGLGVSATGFKSPQGDVVGGTLGLAGGYGAEVHAGPTGTYARTVFGSCNANASGSQGRNQK